MEDGVFDITFGIAEKKHTGRVNRSERHDHLGKPVSFHVELDHIFFGELQLVDCHWIINKSRPHYLVEAVGKEIEKYYSL
jgi:hypothetical protein